MIQGILDTFFNLITYLLDFLPSFDFSTIFNNDALNFFKNIMSFMLYFFPRDLFVSIFSSVAFWVSLQFIWAVIEFILKKFMLS